MLGADVNAVSRMAGGLWAGFCHPLPVTYGHSPAIPPELLFYLSRFLISSCAFSSSGGTKTELAEPPVPPIALPSGPASAEAASVVRASVDRKPTPGPRIMSPLTSSI